MSKITSKDCHFSKSAFYRNYNYRELKMDGIRRIDDLLATCPVVLQAEIHT